MSSGCVSVRLRVWMMITIRCLTQMSRVTLPLFCLLVLPQLTVYEYIYIFILNNYYCEMTLTTDTLTHIRHKMYYLSLMAAQVFEYLEILTTKTKKICPPSIRYEIT